MAKNPQKIFRFGFASAIFTSFVGDGVNFTVGVVVGVSVLVNFGTLVGIEVGIVVGKIYFVGTKVAGAVFISAEQT